MGRTYRRGTEYPNEGFVQQSIEAHFLKAGFRPTSEGTADLTSVHPTTGERWVVEAKGQTADIGLDFRTGLGQILQQMRDETSRYALAVPAIPQFLHQCRKVSPRVRQALPLYWLFVEPDGTVRVCEPSEGV